MAHEPPRQRRRGGLRRALRRVGMVLQILLCAGLATWAAVAREMLYLAVAAVLGVVAIGLLVRELRAGPGTSDEPR